MRVTLCKKSKFSKERYRKFEKKTSGSLSYWHTSVFITSKNRLFLLVFRNITKIEKIIGLQEAVVK